ncbi:hypothetical protein [Actinomyces sp.]|uniref:hypothetical protein n=1 Tax=Actinomyces sp. TaxID=29317 RepID=UPI0026DB3539|nr:hypothetical protein [Actinomyces sp.]MDO4901882.1 hypothetical protein [Actinomyces sp.]
MTQSPNPGQPYIPPSAGSAPSSYNPQQYVQQPQQPTQYQPAQPGQPQPGQYAQAAYVGDQYAQAAAPKAESLMNNLFDGTRDFASKYGRTIFTIGFVLYVTAWVFTAFWGNFSTYNNEFNFLGFLLRLIIDIPGVAVQVLILRLIIEIASKVGSPKTGTPAA